MGNRNKAAFALYFMVALAIIVFGIAYLTCPTIMPYHQEAVIIAWEDLSRELQVLLQALIKMTAAGFFVTGLSTLILLLVPFKRGQAWAYWAVPLPGVVWLGISLFVTITVAVNTEASPPWPAALAGLIILVVAFFLSTGKDRVKAVSS